jgi:DNA-binding transcriptional LysR family regulator
MELPSFEGLRGAVVESGAIAFGPRYAVEDDFNSGRLVAIDIASFSISATTYVLNRPDVREPGRWLIELLTQAETLSSIPT